MDLFDLRKYIGKLVTVYPELYMDFNDILIELYNNKITKESIHNSWGQIQTLIKEIDEQTE